MGKNKNSIDEVMEGITLQDIVDDYNKMNDSNQQIKIVKRERRSMRKVYMDCKQLLM